MKRFIFSVFLFTIPFFVFIIITEIFYTKSGGDLNRLGKVSIKADYRDIFNKEILTDKKFTNFSDLDFSKNHQFDAFIIGDSFSKESDYCYQNYICNCNNISIVNFDYDSYVMFDYNPIEFIYKAINGNLFKNINVKYIILQSSVRYFIIRSFNVDTNSIILIKDLNKLKIINKKHKKQIFVDTIKYPIYNLLYKFDYRAFFSPVYKIKMKKKLFSIDDNFILFFYEDIENIKYVSDTAISNLNDVLNDLSDRLRKINIDLIVLPSPDKYDLYYNYIYNNDLPRNDFFKLIKNKNKNYIFIDSKNLLIKYLEKGENDMYYADDTHWSPKANKIIAYNIVSIMNIN